MILSLNMQIVFSTTIIFAILGRIYHVVMQNGLEHPDMGLATLELLDVKSAESGRLETLLVPFSDRFQKRDQQMASQCHHTTCM